MKASYLKALDQMELGSNREAEHLIEELRRMNEEKPHPETELWRRLLATRLHYKQKKSLPDADTFLNETLTKDPFIKAEILFVKGLNCFHAEDFKSGAQLFKQAADHYPPEFAAKGLLALYNEYIGLLNAGSLDEAQEENQLSYLERMSHRLDADKMRGMILRQKSYFLEKKGHLKSSVDAASEGLKALLKSGSISDYQLLLLQKCDLLISLGQRNEAETLLHGMLGPFDSRILFAQAYVQSRLVDGTLPNPDNFAVVPPIWRNKLTSKPAPSHSLADSCTWHAAEGILALPSGEEILLKRDSIEGQILNLLIKGRKDRAALCAALWPDDIDSELLHDRLKKTLRRLKTKHPDLVQFEHGYYILGLPLKTI